MCLSLSLWNFSSKVASEDIICYKTLAKIEYPKIGIVYYKTPYMGVLIDIGFTYTSKLKRSGFTIEDGLHSFKHAYDTHLANSCWRSVVSVQCVIPKGSKYYKGTFLGADSYASSQLIYVKIIE